jgi:farnesyl diphosphate synthase
MTSARDIDADVKGLQARVEEVLARWLPRADSRPTRLHRAMRYAVLGGGKRVRPTLVYATGLALGLPRQRLDGPAAAVELVHAYSLIHDDLPAMDDDDLRRGKPTCHKAFDEATAILAGDAIQALAFYILAHDPEMVDQPVLRLRMLECLARASGSHGMAGGQAIDLDATGRQLDIVELENMHILKTGALIRASVTLGALSQPDISKETLEQLDRYAKCVGLAFQIRDDILDVVGDAAVIGKTRGKDQAQQKATYPALMGLDGARQSAAELIADAVESLAPFGADADPLRWVAGYMVQRDR